MLLIHCSYIIFPLITTFLSLKKKKTVGLNEASVKYTCGMFSVNSLKRFVVLENTYFSNYYFHNNMVCTYNATPDFILYIFLYTISVLTLN